MCDHLRTAIAPYTTYTTLPGRFFRFFFVYIHRASQRLDALYTKWRNGTLRPTRPTRPTRPARPRTTPSRPPEFRLPQGKLWLLKRVPNTAGSYDALRVMMQDPEFLQFLREVPRAIRMLRPFSLAIGFEWPGDAEKPRRIRKPRPKPPKPEKPRWGKYTPRQLRNYSPGKIPDTIRRPAGTQKRPPR